MPPVVPGVPGVAPGTPSAAEVAPATPAIPGVPGPAPGSGEPAASPTEAAINAQAAAAITREQFKSEFARLVKENPEEYEALAQELDLRIPLKRITEINAKRDEAVKQVENFNKRLQETFKVNSLDELIPQVQQAGQRLGWLDGYWGWLQQNDPDFARMAMESMEQFNKAHGAQPAPQPKPAAPERDPEVDEAVKFAKTEKFEREKAAISQAYSNGFGSLVKESGIAPELVPVVDARVRERMGFDIQVNGKNPQAVMENMDVYFHEIVKDIMGPVSKMAESLAAKKAKEYAQTKQTDIAPSATGNAGAMKTEPVLLRTPEERKAYFAKMRLGQVE